MESLYERSLKVFPPVAGRATKIGAVSGQGSWLIDENGKKYLDFAAGVAVVNCGHNHPKVVEAVEKQLHELVHGGHNVVYYPKYVELAEKLVARVGKPGEYKVYFSNSGAEANEGAVKLALKATGRPGIIAFNGSFHGRTLLCASMTASSALYRENYEPELPQVYHADFPDVWNTDLTEQEEIERCLNSVHKIFTNLILPERVACMVIEPVQGEGGYLPAPKRFISELQKICDEHGILLIFDEVQSGYGRTGYLFAKDYYGVQPDIFTSAKAIANGIPLSAVIGKTEYMDKWLAGAHGGTFGGNPLACAAGCAVLDVMDDEFLEDVRKKGEFIRERLEDLKAKHSNVISSIRGIGMMNGVEFRKDGKPLTKVVSKVQELALSKGLILLNCGTFHNVIRLIPPLTATKEEIERAIGIIDECLKEIEG